MEQQADPPTSVPAEGNGNVNSNEDSPIGQLEEQRPTTRIRRNPIVEISLPPSTPIFRGPTPRQDEEDSPLSDIPDDFFLHEKSLETFDAFFTEGGISEEAPIALNTIDESLPQNVPDLWIRDASRNLRQRTAIQLHPYKLETEKYRQSLKARGLRPVQVVTNTQQYSESEDDGEYDADQPQVSSPHQEAVASSSTSQEDHASRMLVSGFRMPPPLTGPDTSDDVSVQLPELPRPQTDIRQNRHKRRKLNTTPKVVQGKAHTPVRTDSAASRHNKESLFPAGDNVFDLSPSPSPEQAIASHNVQPWPNRKYTFGARLGIHFRGSRLIAVASGEDSRDDDSDIVAISQEPNTHSRSQSAIIVSSDNEGSSEPESESQIRVIQKRIKGVLPASWLKLDQQAQVKKKVTEMPKQRQDNLDDETHRGVARRIVRGSRILPGLTSPPRATVVSNGSQSSSDEEPNITHNAVDAAVALNALWAEDSLSFSVPNDADPGEMMEDNGIDIMAPTLSRRRAKEKPTKRRQLRLDDAFHLQTKRRKIDAGLSNFNSKPKGAVRKHKTSGYSRGESTTSRKRKNAVKLSIVDVVAAPSEPSFKAPPFLRVAARQARKSKNQGRHNPSQKHIRLRTREDTEDATSVLRHWRAGDLQPRSDLHLKSQAGRVPLAERSPNEILGNRQHAPQVRRVMKQTKLRPVAVPQDVQPRPLQTKSSEPQRRKSPTVNSPGPRKKRQWEAQLQELQQNYDQGRPHMAFKRQLHDMMKARVAEDGPGYLLNRYVHEDEPSKEKESPIITLEKADSPVPKQTAKAGRRSRRKRSPRRLDTELREYRQPDESPKLTHAATTQPGDIVVVGDTDNPALSGLNGMIAKFSISFDIRPLSVGTYFHATTFIGNGEFAKSLAMNHRAFDVLKGPHVVSFGEFDCVWSEWNEDMAEETTRAFHRAANQMRQISTHCQPMQAENTSSSPAASDILRQIIESNNNWLCFADSVDRAGCIASFYNNLNALADATLESVEQLGAGELSSSITSELLRTLMFELVLARQLIAIAHSTPQQHGHIDLQLNSELLLVKRLALAIMHFMLRRGFEPLRKFLEDNNRHASREQGIRDDAVEVHAIVVLQHALLDLPAANCSTWQLFNQECQSRLIDTVDVYTIEELWLDMFSMLPFFEFDSAGTLRLGDPVPTIIRQLGLRPRHDLEALRAICSALFNARQQCQSLSSVTHVSMPSSYPSMGLAQMRVSYWYPLRLFGEEQLLLR